MVARLQYLRFCLFEMYVSVVFVIRCLYSAVSLTLMKEQRFIRIIIIIISSSSSSSSSSNSSSSSSITSSVLA